MRGITKRFGNVLANDAVDLDLLPGEIHGLLGENGSGKTTLMNILYGFYRPDAGEIRLRERRVQWQRPKQALANGIAMIPQQFRLVPNLTVAENVAMGLDGRGRHGRLLKEVGVRLRDLAEGYGLAVNPDARIDALSMGERQRVEILRALYHDARVLLMDEPTSVLTPGEVDALFATLVQLVRTEERTVVLVTHKAREVLALANQVTVLRRGRRVANLPTAGLTRDRLVDLLMGERAPAAGEPPAPRRAREPGADVLEVAGLRVDPNPGQALASQPLHGVSFTVRAGEVFGVAGVEGNGQRELEFALAGLLQPSAGQIRISGQAGGGPAEPPVAYIPSDRNQWGVVRQATVLENLLIRELAQTPDLARAPAGRPEAVAAAQRLTERYKVYPPDPTLTAAQLSGGNAQKVVLARELSRRPVAVVAAQPTMGLDVGAARFVRQELRACADAGAGVLLISSDLDELLELCDRIAVMYRGEIMGIWEAHEATVSVLGTAMAGFRAEAEREEATHVGT